MITSNPLPLNKIFDVFFIGDGEPNLIPFLDKVIEWKASKTNLSFLYNKIKKMNGIYIPSINNIPKRAILENLDSSPNPIYQTILSEQQNNTIFENNFFVEINRGCPFKCKFCISSFHNFPFRNKSYDNIIQLIDKGILRSKFEKISLIGSCVSSHPKFKEICKYIIKKGKKLSIPSIRLEHITDDIIHILEQANIKTITIAPETGSESLRYEIGKKISDKKIFEVVKKIHDSKIPNIKFYFLVGLPNESDEDVNKILDLLRKVNKLGFPREALKVNVNPFIPKFHTPYGNFVHYFLDDNLNEIKGKFQKLYDDLKGISSIKLKFQYPKKIIKKGKIQTLFSMGDTRMSDLLMEFYKKGAKFSDLKKAEEQIGFSTNDYLLKIKEGYMPWIV